jgi:hypothetical protein
VHYGISEERRERRGQTYKKFEAKTDENIQIIIKNNLYIQEALNRRS